MRGVMVAIISGLLSAGCSVFGVRNEKTPAYTVERTIEAGIEIRHYGPRLAAETAVSGTESAARSKGFQRLAGYIFGGNTSKASIDMTAPVAQSKSIDMTAPVSQTRTGNDQFRIRFFMPANYTLETLPRPNDQAIEIVTVPSETIAVLRYSGSTGADAVHASEATLMRAVTRRGTASEWCPVHVVLRPAMDPAAPPSHGSRRHPPTQLRRTPMKQPHTEKSIDHTDDQQNTGNHKKPGEKDAHGADKFGGTRAGADNVEPEKS